MQRKSQSIRVPRSEAPHLRSDLGGRSVTFADGSKRLELDGRFQSFGSLICVDCLKENCGDGCCAGELDMLMLLGLLVLAYLRNANC